MLATGKIALVLSGGGARGAYQAGVLKGVSEILNTNLSGKNQSVKNQSTASWPFQILSGNSAGAINAAFLAASTENFSNTIEKLVYLWSTLQPENVFKPDILSTNRLSLKSLIGLDKSKSLLQLNSLLDTSPLRDLIEKNCDFKAIQKNLDQRKIEAVIISANNYHQGGTFNFIQTPQIFDNSKLDWGKSRRRPVKTHLTTDHILASSAIPMLFPPIKIENEFYGDGCVRNHTPCSPSLRLGAEKLFVIGVRTRQDKNEAAKATVVESTISRPENVSFIGIMNTLLNAVLMDSVEQDVQRIERINELVALSSQKSGELKNVPLFSLSPSKHLADLARQRSHKLPRLLRMSISAVGHIDEAAEIISYLMFESDYCKNLIEIGYEDSLSVKNEILDFFAEDRPPQSKTSPRFSSEGGSL